MNNLNIPIYRAKKIDSDEYVIGNLIEDEGVFYIIKNPVVTHFNGLQQLTGECEYLDRVDPTILAINLPDMLDSKGNKIFASLSEDGKGGDIVTLDDRNKTIIYDKKVQAIMLNCKNFGLSILSLYKEDIKAIGIQK